jgi:hypothetical protein
MYSNNNIRRQGFIAILALAHFCITGAVSAQQNPAGSDTELKKPEPDVNKTLAQANNPLASFTAFNQHNYFIGKLTDSDEIANTYWIRCAAPFKLGNQTWLFRGSLPMNTYPTPPTGHHDTGLGDVNIQAFMLIDVGDPKITLGIGPQLTAPTASKGTLGSEKWSAGFANTLFYATPKWQLGYLLSWQGSFAGQDDRRDVSVGAFQPFVFHQIGHGAYLRSSAVMVYDFDNDNYTVPIGFGIGQVLPTKKVVYNVFIEPQFSISDRGAGWPEWQIFFAVNMQFKN